MQHPPEPTRRWDPPDLSGRVAVVTGGSRGIGRGIAEVLGGCGATVYVVARSSGRVAAPGRTGTVEDVVGAIEASGGTGRAMACDVSDDAAVAALFARIGDEAGGVDLLVNNAVGWSTDVDASEFWSKPPWDAPAWWWGANFDVGVRSHFTVTNAAVPLLRGRSGAAVLFTSERQPAEPGLQEMVMDLRGTAVARMALLYSLHLRPLGVASVLLYPQFTRTDAIVREFENGAGYFDGWTEDDFHQRTASIYYAGRAAAALAGDPALLERSGELISAYDAAEHYGFNDVTGHRPNPL